METTADLVAPPQPPPQLKPTSFPAAVDSEIDLYTIPSHSCWFSWDSIHETERVELREFFDGSSFTRTPKIYKDYRDFIISKYREDASRRLTFTEVRKSLVGDVCVLRKVFNFLDKWGLINFSASPAAVEKEDEDPKVRVEEGAPIGIRVVATPNSSKPLAVPPPVTAVNGEGGGGGVDNGFKLPPLASYSDVFGCLGEEKGMFCGNCKEKCDSKYYEWTKEKYLICFECYEKGIYGENKSADDFKLHDSLESSAKQGAVWTEAETLLLLESVLKHGDDWELVAQNVQTKSKLECISRLIELPFGELMLGSHDKCSPKGVDGADAVQEQKLLSEPQKAGKVEDDDNQEIVEQDNGEKIESLEPPLKKKRVDTSDPSRSLMEQVALISTMVGSRITATAASAAVSVLSDGNPLVREIFYSEDNTSLEDRRLGNLDTELEKASQSGDSEMMDASHSSEVDKISSSARDSIPLALQMRAAVATALGAAAVHARLLADQEEREIEHLMACIIETQLKKLQRKAKFFEDLEQLMEKEHAVLDELKDSMVAERIDTIQRIFADEVPRWKDHSLLKLPPGSLQE